MSRYGVRHESLFPKMRMTLDEIQQSPECPICFVDFLEDEEVYLIPCYHIFHSQCLDIWWKRDPSCPLCTVNSFTRRPDEGFMLRYQKTTQIRAEKAERMHRKALKDMTTDEVLARLAELQVGTQGMTEHWDLVDLLVCYDPLMGVRVDGRDDLVPCDTPPACDSATDGISEGAATDLSEANNEEAVAVEPAVPLLPEQKGADALSNTELKAYLASIHVSTVGVVERGGLIELYNLHKQRRAPPAESDPVVSPDEITLDLPTPQKPPDEMSNRELKELLQAMRVSTAGIIERQGLLDLVALHRPSKRLRDMSDAELRKNLDLLHIKHDGMDRQDLIETLSICRPDIGMRVS